MGQCSAKIETPRSAGAVKDRGSFDLILSLMPTRRRQRTSTYWARKWVVSHRNTSIDPTPRRLGIRINWIPVIPLLGRVPDAVAGRKVGATAFMVRRYRRKHGIEGFSSRELRNQFYDTPNVLGGTWDQQIADLFGVCKTAIMHARKRRDIPCYREEAVCPCGKAFTKRSPRQRFCSEDCCQLCKRGSSNQAVYRYIPDIAYRIGLLSHRITAVTKGGLDGHQKKAAQPRRSTSGRRMEQH